MGNETVRIVRVYPDSTVNENLIQSVQIDNMVSDKPVPSHEGYWWFAKKGDLVVGFACLKVCAGMPYGYLARSGVYEQSRGEGIQQKLIYARERHARTLGLTHMVCDTSRANLASSNSLIRCGYKLYAPIEPWAFADGNYWIKRL